VADQVSASVTGPPWLTAVSALPSQLLTVKVLRRPVESALAALIAVEHDPVQGFPATADRDRHGKRAVGGFGVVVLADREPDDPP
jgi:hypothetical protein